MTGSPWLPSACLRGGRAGLHRALHGFHAALAACACALYVAVSHQGLHSLQPTAWREQRPPPLAHAAVTSTPQVQHGALVQEGVLHHGRVC
jgi:hypothetical protein